MPNCFSTLVPAWARSQTKTCKSTALPKAEPFDAGAAIDDPPPSYVHEPRAGGFSEDILQTIEREIASQDDSLRLLNLDIHTHPELAWEERYAHDALTKFMEDRSWKVTRHYLGFETAWRAEWSHGSGGRVVGVNSEMDALPGIGHACGHNLIATAGVAVALGIKAAMETHNISGKVILLGTPAEEGGTGKVHLLNKGAYDEMDVCVMSHPGTGPYTQAEAIGTLAIQAVDVEFHGHTAHAGAQPWEGQNALDAAVLTYNAVSVLRQQIKPDHRIHGIIEGKNWAPNIIPDYAKMRWLVRAPTSDEVIALRDRLLNCIKAASLASACKAEVSVGLVMKDLKQNITLSREFAGVLEKYGYTTRIGPDVVTTASTDFGNITYALPAIHPGYGITTVPGAGNHTAAFTKEAATQEAHNTALNISKALAMTGVRVLTDGAFFEKVKQEFVESSVPSLS
ncbi:hypothetical protein EXIGLDRAFT_666461 [Exidia glandulosa HHB12029]|uniref:Peptidase M20 domain-containing protein 2 n=1 Tax=Exidia glandulosa HHB12029 TaxID=1314781 RepID=A0A165NT79_EXIGL|nr:hypothetical protein EXIGLDRAFT_666461 [Exidia glandulosa HHB12029]